VPSFQVCGSLELFGLYKVVASQASRAKADAGNKGSVCAKRGDDDCDKTQGQDDAGQGKKYPQAL
jgi:hypothetical protein